jgi:hypothetical protein
LTLFRAVHGRDNRSRCYSRMALGYDWQRQLCFRFYSHRSYRVQARHST